MYKTSEFKVVGKTLVGWKKNIKTKQRLNKIKIYLKMRTKPYLFHRLTKYTCRPTQV